MLSTEDACIDTRPSPHKLPVHDTEARGGSNGFLSRPTPGARRLRVLGGAGGDLAGSLLGPDGLWV